jgi:hypothetical protein
MEKRTEKDGEYVKRKMENWLKNDKKWWYNDGEGMDLLG